MKQLEGIRVRRQPTPRMREVISLHRRYVDRLHQMSNEAAASGYEKAAAGFRREAQEHLRYVVALEEEWSF